MILNNLEETDPLVRLRKIWAATALLGLALLGAGYSLLQDWWQPALAGRWFLLAGAAAAYLMWVFWRGLAYNYRAGEGLLLPHLGAGNTLTLVRGLLVAGVAGFLFSPAPPGALAWAPGLLFTLAMVADYFDGYLARVTRHATRLGEILDMSFDSLAVLAGVALAVQYGQAPAWYLLVALARYIFLAGIWLRHRSGRPVYDLPPSARRRGFAGLQMGFVAALLMPVFTPPGTHLAAALFALPVLASFARDWLIVSGSLVPPDGGTAPGWRAVLRWLPVALRLAAAGLLAALLAGRFLDFSNQVGLYAGRGLPAPQAGLLLLGLLEAIVLLLVLLGAAGRVAAALGLLALGLHQALAGLSPAQLALLVVYTALLFMGSGALSLWKPEDRFIYR